MPCGVQERYVEEDDEEEDDDDDDEEEENDTLTINNDDIVEENELGIEDLEEEKKENEEEDFKEMDISSLREDSLETVSLKKPNEVYFKLYKDAREKAKKAKKALILAYLDAKNIKKTYMLDEMNESDNEFDAEIEETSEKELEGL